MPQTWPNGRALLILARLPHLPTVWSNWLAAWLLSGGSELPRLFWGCLGASFLYLGGTFLNDYFDFDFDRQHRRNRPIPAGRIPRAAAAQLGVVWLVVGVGLVTVGAGAGLGLTLLLVSAIVVYDAIHKVTELSPVWLGFCRFLLYLLAASTAREGVAGLAIWNGLAMGCYIAGLAYFARREAIRGPIRRWPLALLAVPLGLGWISNAGEHRQAAVWLGLVLCLWTLPCLRHALREEEPNLGLTVSGLLAGIVLVDLLAVGGHSSGVALIFAALFLSVLVAQRYLPAT